MAVFAGDSAAAGGDRPRGKLARGRVGPFASAVLTVYLYQNCSTCRDARKWLQAKGVAFEEKAIRETPPSVAELRRAEAVLGLSKLFNSSGNDYREMGMKDRLPGMSRDEAFELLSRHGNLVKRPFVLGEDVALTGFKPAQWAAALGVEA